MAILSTVAGASVAPLVSAATTRPDSTIMAIDCHAHVFLRTLPMPDRRRAPSGYDAPPEDYLRVLAANKMTHGVLVQPSFLGTDNSYLLAALRQYPDKFKGIAVIDPSITVTQLDELQQAGVAGIRLNLIGLPTPDFQSPSWKQLLQEIRQRQWQIEVHQIAAELKPVVEPLLSADIRVVVDHFGRPDAKLGVEDPGFQYLLTMASTRRLWVKLSAAYRNGANGRGEAVAKEAIPLLRQHFGLDRLIWGSDWPHTLFESSIHYADQRQLLNQWVADAQEQRVILQDTPAKLFGFTASSLA